MSNLDNVISFDPVAAFLRRPLHEIVGGGLPQLDVPPKTEPKSISTLQKLASEYAWVSVLDLTASLLAAADVTSNEANALRPHERLMCTMYRTLALVQTGQLDRASTAIEQLGDLSDENKEYRYENYKKVYKEQVGSFIPVELRMLAIDIRIRRGDYDAIIDAYDLKNEICERDNDGNDDNNSPKKNEHLELMLSALASYHLKMGQSDAGVDTAYELATMCDDEDGWYMYGKVLLHVGDFDGCEEMFSKAMEVSSEPNQAKRHAHKAMLLAGRAKFTEAITEYDEAGELVTEQDGNLSVMIANNVAICLLHVGRVAEAIDRLEKVLRKNPRMALDEGVVFNLGTLYELLYPDSSNEKKRVLKRLAERFGREGFQIDNFGSEN